MVATQKHRVMGVVSSLGKDALLLRRAEIHEQLSHSFEFNLELFSENNNIKFTDVLGRPMMVWMKLPDERQRYFHGWVSQFRQVQNRGRYAVYRASLRPWLWFLSRTTDCRIYQNQKTLDIVKSIFRENGFTDFEVRLSGQYS
ncbi:MAG: type VI secretion system tip protein VgrG, partial [Leptospiraceae bacterium]|nr:type VI secretion system tip protein VgrG [Leptospiraceae bacterium]